MDFLIKRWHNISKKGKAFHMYLGASLYRNVPLVLLIMLIMEMLNRYRYINSAQVLTNLGVKLILAYLVGIYIGHLEWHFLDKLFNNKFQRNIDFRMNYIYTYGICMFGTTMLFGVVDPYFMSLRRIIITCIVYLIMAVLWGIYMSYTASKDIFNSNEIN